MTTEETETFVFVVDADGTARFERCAGAN